MQIDKQKMLDMILDAKREDPEIGGFAEWLAEYLAKKNNTSADKELASLIKQKAIITGVPYAFGLAVMGFTLSAVTRIWTKYRYKHQTANVQNNGR